MQRVSSTRWRWLTLSVLVSRAWLAGVLALASEPAAFQAASNHPTNTLTLDGAIGLALANNPELKASSGRVDAAAARADQAGKWTNPELQLNADEWPVSGGRGFSSAMRTIGVAQTLPFPGKKSLDKRVGGAGVKVSEAELALRRTETVRDVKAGFFAVLAAERLVAVSTQLVAVAESSAVTARKRVTAGAAPDQEQLRAEVQLEQARTELTEFERELETARQALATLLSWRGLGEIRLVGELAEAPRPDLMEDGAARDALLRRHPSAAAARANVDRAQLEHRRARLEPYPDVTVALSGGKLGESDQSIIQLGFSLPLPVIDRFKGKQRESRANLGMAEAEEQVVQQQLYREWANALKRYQAAAKQVASYRERILPKAGEALRLVQTGFQQGKFGLIDLLDTQRTTAEARLAYQQKLLELNISQAELEALLQPQTNSPNLNN